MFGKSLKSGLLVGGLTLLAPAFSMAYFPPPEGVNPNTPVPNPIPSNPVGGVGEPEAPDPVGQPTVATPEPASIVSAVTALSLLAGYAVYRRRESMMAMN